MAMIERRPRMRRTRLGKPLALTERDIAIFRTLNQYRYLRSGYLHAFAGGVSEKRFVERLGDLFHEGYLDRPEAQWEFANARTSPAVYELGAGGRRALEGLGCKEGEARTFLGRLAHRQFAHSTMICAFLASMELGTRAYAGLRFVPWPEILSKAPEPTKRLDAPFRLPGRLGTIVPDSMFGLEYLRNDGSRAYRFFALEADRETMPLTRSAPGQTSLIGKLTVYADFIAEGRHKSHLGIPNLLVLTAAPSVRRIEGAIERLANAAPILFKAAGALVKPSEGLLSESWQRAGHPPIRIDESG